MNILPLLSEVAGYFAKNKGMNTVTAALAVPAVMAAAEGVSDLQGLAELVGPEVVGYVSSGPMGWVAAGLIIGARVLMAVKRKRETS